MTVFDNAKALWQWEFSQQAEQTYAAAADTARLDAGAAILLAKVMDGAAWAASWDPGNAGSVAALQAAAAQTRLAGVTLVPWVVPHGYDPAGEAAAHAALGPVLVCDIEPYQGFWTGPVENAPVYLQALRQGGVRELHVTLDPRPSALQALNVPAWDLLVDGLHPQCYWTDFQTPALNVVPLIQNLQLPDGPKVYPVLPGDGAAADLAAVWQAVQQFAAPITGVSVWRLGSMNLAQLQAFASLGNSAQEADMTPDQVNAAIAAAVAPLQAQLDRLNQVLTARFSLVRSNLTAAAAALDPANPPS